MLTRLTSLRLLAIAFCLLGPARSAFAVACPVVAAPHLPSPAEQAFLRGNFDQAVTLYRQALQPEANDPALTVGLVESLLGQQKVAEAQEIIEKAVAAQPKSIPLQTELGEVQYRAGTPWLAAETANAAWKLDPCYPRLHLLRMRLLHLNSMYAAAADELRTAHAIDRFDPAIQRYWFDTLPLKQRIAEMETYLASGTGTDADDRARLELYLESLKKRLTQPPKPCRLVSAVANTEIPFVPLLHDATHIRAFGLDVKLNDRAVRLQIDTGASGLLINRSVAERAGLTAFSKTEVGGIGDQGQKQGYMAFADSIRIGTLEFHDCAVSVMESRNDADSDGLIGMDVFSNMLVTLDYPVRKLALGPLPSRPEDAVPVQPALETDDNGEEQASRAAEVHAPRNRYIAPEMKDWTSIYRLGHQLMIPATLNQTTKKLFILDTGSFSTTISTAAARELGKLHSQDWLTVRGLSGKVDKVYFIDNVTFAFANLKQKAEQAVTFDLSGINRHTGIEVSGFIGFTTLSQLTMHIDYRDGLVKFDYNPNRGFRR